MQELVTAIVALLLLLWVTWRWKRTSVFSDLGIPGPTPSIIFGNIIELYLKGPIRCEKEWIEKHGRILGYYYGMTPVLLVADPQMLKNIFIKDFSKFVDRASFNPIAKPNYKDEYDRSVLVLKGNEWKEIRSTITPSFTTSKMKKMSVIMQPPFATLMNILAEKAASGEVFDIHEAYQRLTLDVIARTAFAVEINVQTNPDSVLLRNTKLIFRTRFRSIFIFVGMVFPGLRYLTMKTMLILLRFLNRGTTPVTYLRAGLMKVLQVRRNKSQVREVDFLQLLMDAKVKLSAFSMGYRELEAGYSDELHEDTESKDNASDNTSKANRNMTNKEIVASSLTVLLAGYETTSNALSFTSYLLAKHQDVQEKLFQEIHEAVQNSSKLDYDTVNRLPYLDKVLSESLRLYPPVTLFTNRYALEDVQYGSLKIPKGMVIQAATYYLHHDCDYWPDAETFDPERFETKPNQDGIMYLPFGIGPRNCLGMRFAQMEAKLGLAHILTRFRLYISSQQKYDLPLRLMMRTITPADGVNIKLEPRNNDDAS